jgi:hypothetical protein
MHISDVASGERYPQSTGYRMGRSHLISKIGQRGQLQDPGTVAHTVDQRSQFAASHLELGTCGRIVRLDEARQSFEPVQIKSLRDGKSGRSGSETKAPSCHFV